MNEIKNICIYFIFSSLILSSSAISIWYFFAALFNFDIHSFYKCLLFAQPLLLSFIIVQYFEGNFK